MSETASTQKSWIDEVQGDLKSFLNSLPHKSFFIILMAIWGLIFHFAGNSTFGNVDTSSLFWWLEWNYNSVYGDDKHGLWMPLVVLGLIWWKREELRPVTKECWWPGLLILAFSVFLHIVGFAIQQGRLSTIAFFGGIFGIMGALWGRRWLFAIFFPYVLFAFAVPIGQLSESLTFPLRIISTSISVGIAKALNVDVVQQGTQILGEGGRFAFDVAPACSGIRSLTAMLLVTIIYSFLNFKSPWRKLILISSALPLAILGNVIRLTFVIMVSQAFDQKAGLYIETKLGFITFAVGLGGVLVLGYFLREKKKSAKNVVESVSSTPITTNLA